MMFVAVETLRQEGTNCGSLSDSFSTVSLSNIKKIIQRPMTPKDRLLYRHYSI